MKIPWGQQSVLSGRLSHARARVCVCVCVCVCGFFFLYSSCSIYCFQCTTQSAIYVYMTHEFPAALLHAGNVKQLFSTIVCSLKMFC